jgi:HAD superfamily hydrolase (TIGR01450 family)
VKDYLTYLLDLDGVVYRGEQLLPGARDFVAWLNATGRAYRYISNNSMASPAEVAAKLRRLGIPAPDERVVTASQAAVDYLAAHYHDQPIWVVGLPPLRQMAARAGLRVLNLTRGDAPDDAAAPAETARVVLVGLHRAVTYADLRQATHAILAGAQLIGVNRDPQLPVENGEIDPGCGAILAALEVAGRTHGAIIGKPAPTILTTALAALRADPATAVMIGDAIELDIAAGHAAGIDTILLLSGLTSPERAATADPAPTYVMRDLAEVLSQACAAGR